MCCQCIKNQYHIIMLLCIMRIILKYLKKLIFMKKLPFLKTLTLAAHQCPFIFFNSTDAKNPFPTLPLTYTFYKFAGPVSPEVLSSCFLYFALVSSIASLCCCSISFASFASVAFFIPSFEFASAVLFPTN